MKNFKLGFYLDIKNKEMLDLVNDGEGHDVLLSTNRLNIEHDNRDQRLIKTLKEVKLIYELECSPNLIEAMPKYFNKEEIELYNRFKLETNLEDINSFVNYLDELISVTSPYIEVYVSSSRYNFDNLSKYVRTIVSDDIYKGIKIVFKNKVYDFSLNERNV